MMWTKIDDQFSNHPKVVKAGPMAAWMYVCGLTYCSRYLTNGKIPFAQVPMLTSLKNPSELTKKLVNCGLWEETNQGYEVHDYLDWNPSAEIVKEQREVSKKRLEKWRSKRVTNAVAAPVPSHIYINNNKDAPVTNGVSKAITPDFLASLKSQSRFDRIDIDFELERWQTWKISKGRRYKSDRAGFSTWLLGELKKLPVETEEYSSFRDRYQRGKSL